MKKLLASSLASCLLSTACGAPVDAPPAAPAEALAATRQAVSTFNLSWADNQATADCRFGDNSLGHQAATDTRASGRVEEFVSISGLAGRRIVSLRLSSASNQNFKYDDVMLVALNGHLVMASDNRLTVALAGTALGNIGATPVGYNWRKLLNTDINNQTRQPAWCPQGSTACQVPVTEATGTLDVNIPNFAAIDAAAYPTAEDTRTFRLVTVGDNDTSLDCRHGALNLQLEVTTEAVDPLLGLWYSQAWGMEMKSNGTGVITKTPTAACAVGTVQHSNVSKVSCSNATTCNYTATRSAYTDGVTCGLELFPVTLSVNGNRLTEYRNGVLLREWTRALSPAEPILGTWSSGGSMNVLIEGASYYQPGPNVCDGTLVFENLLRTSCSGATACNYTATRGAYTDGITCPLQRFPVTITVNGNTLTEYQGSSVLRTWTR